MLSLTNLSYDSFALQRAVRGMPVLADPKKFVEYKNEDNNVEQWALQGWRQALSSPGVGGNGNYVDIRV